MTITTKNLRDLTDEIGRINGEHGFNDFENVPDDYKHLYVGNKLLLVASELAEAQDEIRSGRTLDDVYLVNEKPEGFLVEIADAVYRLLGIVSEVGLTDEFIDAFNSKTAYNESRPYKHGRQF